MFNRVRERLKHYFLTGKKPTQEHFAQLIDDSLNLGDDGLVVQYDAEGYRQWALKADLNVSRNLCLQGSAHIMGDLYIDGDCLLADGQPVTPAIACPGAANAVPASLPPGSIILWQGQQLPARWQYCDGQQGRPLLNAPAVTPSTSVVYYIIRQ